MDDCIANVYGSDKGMASYWLYQYFVGNNIAESRLRKHSKVNFWSEIYWLKLTDLKKVKIISYFMGSNGNTLQNSIVC